MDRIYPKPICHQCGEICELVEEVETGQLGGDWNQWCYCKGCKLDTFFEPLSPQPMRGEYAE